MGTLAIRNSYLPAPQRIDKINFSAYIARVHRAACTRRLNMLGRFLFIVVVCLVGCKEPKELGCDPFGNCELGVGKLESPPAEEPVVVDSPKDEATTVANDVTPVSVPVELTACSSDLFTIRTICTARGLEDIYVCENEKGCAELFDIYAHLDVKPVSEAERKRLWSSFREQMTSERLQLAGKIVRRWDAEFCDTAVTHEFFVDAVDLADQPELLIAMLLPEWYEDGPDFLNQIDERAGLYIAAQYGTKRVMDAAVQTLKVYGLYREALAFMRRHGTKKQVVALETSLIQFMRRNDCDAFAEDAKGKLRRVYVVTDACEVL